MQNFFSYKNRYSYINPYQNRKEDENVLDMNLFNAVKST